MTSMYLSKLNLLGTNVCFGIDRCLVHTDWIYTVLHWDCIWSSVLFRVQLRQDSLYNLSRKFSHPYYCATAIFLLSMLHKSPWRYHLSGQITLYIFVIYVTQISFEISPLRTDYTVYFCHLCYTNLLLRYHLSGQISLFVFTVNVTYI